MRFWTRQWIADQRLHLQLKAALAGTFILFAGTVCAQDTTKFIALENGTTYALSPSPDQESHSAVATEGVAPAYGSLKARAIVRAEPNTDLKELDVSIADAIAGGTHDPALLECINAVREFDHVGAPAIVFVVTCAHRRPDDYDITLAVMKTLAPTSAGADKQPDRRTGGLAQSQSHTADGAVQKLAVKLTRPVPVLRAIASQSITQTVAWRSVAPSLAPSSLLVSETSNRTLPIAFTAHQVDAARIDGEIVKGRLEFTSGETDSNGHAVLPIRISEPFPLGKAKTTIELRSADLALPIYVTYDVTTKLHGAYVFAAILIGLLLGFFTRTILKAVTGRGAARIAGLDLLDKMRTARDRWSEATFRSTVEPLIATLAQTIAVADAAALKDAVTKADSAFAIASMELQQRIATLLGSIETAAALTNSSVHFPATITDALTRAAEGLAAARMQVVHGHVDEGRTAVETATSTMGHAIEDATADWRTSLQRALTTISSLPPLPPQLQTTLKSTVTALTDEISILPAPSRTPDVATILDGVYTIRFIAEHDLVQRVLVPLTIMAEQIAGVLRSIAADARTIESTRTALLAAVHADLDSTLDGPATAVGDLVQALKKELNAAAAAAHVNVAPELAAGAYLDAATKVAHAGNVSTTVLPVHQQPADNTAAAASIVPRRMRPAPLVPTMLLAAPEPLRVARARTFREIVIANVVQFAIAAVGIAIVGLLALLPAFDGTWRGVVAALFWGYAGDISIDALTDAAKRVK